MMQKQAGRPSKYQTEIKSIWICKNPLKNEKGQNKNSHTEN